MVSGEDGLTGAHARAARGLLGWPLAKAAAAAGLPVETLERIETGAKGVDAGALRNARLAYETAGVRFIAIDGDGGAGVRLRASAPPGVIDAGDLNASNDE
jgi:hypothetical protein